MSLASEALHYRKGGVTYDVPLYTEESDGGPERLAVRVGGNTRYVTLPPIGDVRATDLRVQRAGVIRSVGGRAIVYNPTWTLIATSAAIGSMPLPPAGESREWFFYTWANGISLDVDRLYSPEQPYNVKVVWRDMGYHEDGMTKEPAIFSGVSLSKNATRYHKVSSGTYDIDACTRVAWIWDSSASTWYKYSGGCYVYCVIP